MSIVPLEYLNDKLVEYVLDGFADYSGMDESQMRRIKSLKIMLQERQEGVWEICVGMGMYEAFFNLNGEKKSGSIGGSVERLISQWISRPLNQEAIKSILNL